ncbi:hypothetical protein Tco_0449111 [Tanacetum coccineum]
MPLRYSTISSADVPENIMQQFWKILDICPRKEGEDFTEVQNDEDTLTFLIDLGYSGHVYREKVIIDYFLSKLKSLKKLKFQHFHTIKDDGAVSRLKFVRMGEDVQQYGLVIPGTMLNNKIIQLESYKMFILYSTGQIPPKKSRGKGSQGKKTADTTEESVDVSDESDPEPLIRRKTSRRKVVKKKATISVDDNIIPEPDIALELGKSISLAEAEEEAAAREVHDTHARIVTESVPEPARTIRQSSIAFRDTSSVSKKRTSGTSQKLKGIQSLTPAEQEAAEIMKALKDSKKMIGRQPGTGSSDEGTGEIPGVSDKSIFADAEDDNKETESDYEDIYKYMINVRKKLNIFSVPSDYGNQFLNLSHDEESNKQPPVLQQTTLTPTTIPTLPINTKAPTITTTIPEINHSCPSLESPQLEKIMSEVKKIDHSTTTAQESEKSPEEIIRIKRELEEKKQDPTYTIKSTDKAALEEFDLKSALFKSMHKSPANDILYHALMEALIKDENARDKEVADTVNDHKIKHDGDDDDNDDDEGPPGGSNQGKSTKKRRKRESESTKKPSTTKESSTGKDLKVGSRTGKSAPAKDPFRPIPEEEILASLEPEWVIPPIDLSEADNNWANAFAKAHQDPDENKLQNKIDDIGSFIIWYCRRIGKEELSKADLEGPAFMMPEVIGLFPDIERGVIVNPIAPYTSSVSALSISKLKVALYQNFRLEELVPSLWIESKLNHLPKQDKLGIESYQTKLNLEQPNWDASDFPFKEDYTIVFKPRAVIYRDRDDNRKMMRIDEDTLPILLSFTHCGNKSILRVLRIILVILPEHPSETKVFHNEDGNPARANIKQALGSYERSHKGVKASANSDIVYFFTSPQDGDPLQDDEVDINKKTENQAKMTKLSMEWKRLCKITAKSKMPKVRVTTETQQSNRKSRTEELLLDVILTHLRAGKPLY